MEKRLFTLILLLTCFVVANAQMNTDNSYLRKNYSESKTAKKAAERKARKKAIKEARAAKKQKQATGSKNTESKIISLSDSLYLKGAVPTTADGVVCFEHKFASGNKSSQQIFSILKDFATQKIEETKELDISRILSESSDTLIATICEPLYFKKKKWEADSTLIQYQYFVTKSNNDITLRIWFISYCYEQDRAFGFNYKAEEWITDKYALAKDGLSLLKLPGKFRKKTIDYINQTFKDLDMQIQ